VTKPPKPPRLGPVRQLTFRPEDRQYEEIRAYAAKLAKVTGDPINLNAAIRDLFDRGLASVGGSAYDPQHVGLREAYLAQKTAAAKQFQLALRGLLVPPKCPPVGQGTTDSAEDTDEEGP
jgi:hypothetical protein